MLIVYQGFGFQFSQLVKFNYEIFEDLISLFWVSVKNKKTKKNYIYSLNRHNAFVLDIHINPQMIGTNFGGERSSLKVTNSSPFTPN